MKGYLALVLHAHLPFVRHPEHQVFLEENWLFEAVTETYIPLLQAMEQWRREALPACITFTLTPTLCAMLRDPLLQERCARHLDRLLELAEKEVHRTLWLREEHQVALFYHGRFQSIRDYYYARRGDLVASFRDLQDCGMLEIITSAATHAVLPLLINHPPSVKAQVETGIESYHDCFGRHPQGIWLPECAYTPELDPCLKDAGLLWFITDTHGIMHARPRPRFGIFAPVLTPHGLAAFGRDAASARQVWSRHGGYPGDPRYREFYRDAGFDLDWDYLKPYLATSGQRTYTGLKYHRITGRTGGKAVYSRNEAVIAAAGHAEHFLQGRMSILAELAGLLPLPGLIVSPYDAELFGHWWYEGVEFLDCVVRLACQRRDQVELITPGRYLERHPVHQVATPSPSSWGEGGHWHMWLSEENEWVYRHLQGPQVRLSELAARYASANGLTRRALNQAGRELLLAQASDWPFILRTGTSPAYARERVRTHLARFHMLTQQVSTGKIDERELAAVESADNLFPRLRYESWV